jgi:hypothetical protein
MFDMDFVAHAGPIEHEACQPIHDHGINRYGPADSASAPGSH